MEELRQNIIKQLRKAEVELEAMVIVNLEFEKYVKAHGAQKTVPAHTDLAEISDEMVKVVAVAIDDYFDASSRYVSEPKLVAKAAIQALLASGEVVLKSEVDGMQDDLVNARALLQEIHSSTKHIPDFINDYVYDKPSTKG